MMSRMCTIVIALTLLLACLTASGHSSPPPDTPAVPESNAARDLNEFRSRLETLAKENKVVFLVEGIPLRKNPVTTTPETVEPNPSLIDKIAAQVCDFDYKPVVLGKVILLQKWYSDPQDTPSVTLEECAAVMGDIGRLSRSLLPEVPRYSLYMKWVGDSLTPEQLKDLEAGKLLLRDLSGEQRKAVDRWIGHCHFSGILREAVWTDRFLQPSLNSLLVVLAKYDHNAVSRTYLASGKPDGVMGNLRLDVYGDASVPAAPPFDLPVPNPSLTLGAIVERINEVSKGKPDTPRILLDEMFAAKSAMLVGDLALAPTDTLARGLALMYGLARRVDPQKEIFLTRRIVRVLPGDTALDRLPELLKRMLPDPIRRAIGFDGYARKKQELRDRSDQMYRLGDGYLAESRRIDREERSLETRAITATAWAVLRLRERVKTPERDLAPVLRLPIANLDTPARNLLAGALLLQLGYEFNKWLADLPEWLRNYPDFVASGQGALSGRIYVDEHGEKSVGLDLLRIDPSGVVSQIIQAGGR